MSVVPGISVVIPCYNSPTTLPDLVQDISSHLTNHMVAQFEIILVVDGSPDDTWERVMEIHQDKREIRILRLDKNYGQQAAIFAGISVARHKTLVTMDDDGQHPADTIMTMISKFEEGYHVVYGNPILKSHGIYRRFLSYLLKKLMKQGLGIENSAIFSAYRVIDKQTLDRKVASYDELIAGSLDTLISRSGMKIASQPINMEIRQQGKSNYSLIKLLNYALRIIVSNSIRPLRIALVFGFFGLLISLGGLTYLVLSLIFRDYLVPGYLSLETSILFFGSIQLITIGLIGEYVGLLYLKSIGQKSFVIDQQY
jgi:undecaprenyl-phosphate 4-deoxy-4-formamido-L-arabinose transferase